MNHFPIIGVGASAGGLAAFEALFSDMSKEQNNGMAFVIVQHLAPDHKSMLVDLISGYTNLSVTEASDGMQVEPDSIYIIPPNYEMTLDDDVLRLQRRSHMHELHLPIDTFFRSLAEAKQQDAVGIILSGSGHDGTQGLLAIKRVGGIILVQDPEQLEFDSMPQSAITTGLVDYILPVEQMPPLLRHLHDHASPSSADIIPLNQSDLSPLFELLINHTGHDFSEYKTSTLYRRIERRMAMKQFTNLTDYLTYLHKTPNEIDALFSNLLIGVTRFFRDTEAFEQLQSLLHSSQFLSQSSANPIRIWVCACSTGEEVYSVAILLQELLDKRQSHLTLQIFATDIDGRAINQARAGLYPLGIRDEISPERLKRFFVPQADGLSYRIHKRIRDMVVFSEHDVIKDPPFSKLDLICCRNLLIYMSEPLQNKVLNLFHYALRENGYLFLGSSETLGKLENFFSTIHHKSKIFQKKLDVYGFPRLTIPRKSPRTEVGNVEAKNIPKEDSIMTLPLREFTEQAILKYMAPAAALINEQGDILYLHGRLGKYLEMPAGIVVVNNLLQMARDGLKQILPLALHEAKQTQNIVRRSGIEVKTDEHCSLVNIMLRKLTAAEVNVTDVNLYVLIVEEVLEGNALESLPVVERWDPENPDPDERIEKLKQALHLQEKFLQETNEKLEYSNRELKSYNEEMQSLNEELQSTNEELETSKEELQSVNEELSIVNAELQRKVVDLSHANNDMNNLLAGTGIATVFVDFQLHILRFTPAATKIINLIENDIGRPVGHIVSNLVGYTKLVEDIEQVLETLVPKKTEVKTLDGNSYLLQIQPYRTLDNVIEGAVVSFVNITEMVMLRDELEKTKQMAKLANRTENGRHEIDKSETT